MIGTTYFAWFGTIYLIILSVKDFKNHGLVDDRHNWMMFGITISLYSHFNYRILWVFSIIIMTLLLRYFLGKVKILGEADQNSLAWMFLGFSILHIYYTLWFVLIFSIITILYYSIRRYIFKIKQKTPFYIALLLSFVLNCLLWGLYL